MRRSVQVVCALVGLGCAGAASAQDRGRTDGSEGSEYETGGYMRPSQQRRLSIAPEFGIALANKEAGTTYGPPVYVGGTLTFRGIESVFFDVASQHIFFTKQTNFLVGPRFRIAFPGFFFDLGARAGMILLRDSTLVAAVSPMARMEAMMTNRVFTGVSYSADIPLSSSGQLVHRMGIDVGMRF